MLALRYRVAFSLLILASGTGQLAAQGFEVEEATIADVHAAFMSGELTCVGLVQSYLDRIEAYDKRGRG